MITVREALCWSGVDAMVSLFFVPASEDRVQAEVLVRGADKPTPVDMAQNGERPSAVNSWRLEPEDDEPGCSCVIEIDARFPAVPNDLEAYLRACLQAALDSGASVAWCGFEGSFNFNSLLTDDVAPAVYAVADADGIAIAAEGQRASAAWRERLASARAQLLRSR